MPRPSADLSAALINAPSLETLAASRPELAGIASVWESELAPELQAREQVRVAAVRRAKQRTILGVAAAVLPVGFLLVLSFGSFGILFPFAFLAGVAIVAAFSGFAWLKVYSLKSQTKDLVLAAACRPFGFHYSTLHPDVSGITDFASLKTRSRELAESMGVAGTDDMKSLSTPFGDIKYSINEASGPAAPTPAYGVLKEAGLLPQHDSRKFEDLIEGVRAGATFSLVEARLDTSGDNSSTVFQGILVHVEFSDRFLGRTIMARSGWWKHGKSAKGLQKVDLISRELANAFTVYSSDQVEARELMAPDRMERVIALERHFSGGKLRGIFSDGHMTLALEAPNQFEAGSVFAPLVDPRRFAGALVELGLVCDLIDGFLTRDWVKGRI